MSLCVCIVHAGVAMSVKYVCSFPIKHYYHARSTAVCATIKQNYKINVTRTTTAIITIIIINQHKKIKLTKKKNLSHTHSRSYTMVNANKRIRLSKVMRIFENKFTPF